MRERETLGVKGRVLVELFGPDGGLKCVREAENLVVTAGKNHIADQLSSSPGEAAMGYMAIGTATNAPAAGDTALGGVWVLKDYGKRGFRWVPWLPVDHDPVPKIVAEALEGAYLPIAYSRFGQRKLREVGIEAEYIPHGVDTKVYRPLPREEARASLGLPQDAFIVGMVAANVDYPSRKAFPQNMEAFARFYRRHPEARLYLHCDLVPPRGRTAYNLIELAEFLGIREALLASDPTLRLLGFPPEQMALLYNSFDVLLAASMGEGFGLPLIEAQACGTPVIATDFTSMTELVKAGWLVRPKCKFLTNQISYQAIPDIDSIEECLEAAYRASASEEARERLRQKGRLFALVFDWELLIETKWRRLLENMERI